MRPWQRWGACHREWARGVGRAGETCLGLTLSRGSMVMEENVLVNRMYLETQPRSG